VPAAGQGRLAPPQRGLGLHNARRIALQARAFHALVVGWAVGRGLAEAGMTHVAPVTIQLSVTLQPSRKALHMEANVQSGLSYPVLFAKL